MKYLHIFYLKNNYYVKFKEFLNENFDASQHKVEYMRPASFMDGEISQAKQIWLRINKLIRLQRSLHNFGRIFIHLMPTNQYLAFWLLNFRSLDRCCWVTSGMDVYYPKIKAPGIAKRIVEWSRKFLIPRVGAICGYKSDYEFLQNAYGVTDRHFTTFIPIRDQRFDGIEKWSFNDVRPVRVLVGNSADESNEHAEVFTSVKRFALEEMEIYCPLSYGGKLEYTEEMISLGKHFFQNRFNPIREYKSIEEYSAFLEMMHIGVMNHRRQQGLGNILTLLYMGKKVFMRTSDTPYQFYVNLGLVVFDVEAIKRSSFEEFIHFNREDARSNREIIINNFGSQNLKYLWGRVFDYKDKSL